MKEYNETINYVETTQPDLVAEYIDSLNQKLAEKDQQIADLEKENEVLRKALKLACEDMVSYSGIDYNVLYYIEQVKEQRDE